MTVAKYFQDLDGSVTIQDSAGTIIRGGTAVAKVDSTGKTVGIVGKDGQDFLIVSEDSPSDADGCPDGTIYIQTAA